MRHGIEQGALLGVGSPGDLDLGGLTAEIVAADRKRELVGGEREEAGRGPVRLGGAWPERGFERADRHAVGFHPDPQDRATMGDPRAVSGAFRLRRARLGRSRLVRPDPMGGGVAGRPDEGGDDRRAGEWRPGVRVGDDMRSLAALADDPDPIQGAIPDEALGDLRGRRLDVRLRREDPADREERARFGRSSRRLCRPLRAERRQPADHDGKDQEEHEVEPLLRVADDEREVGGREQEVVQGERSDGRDEGRQSAERRPGHDHRDEIHRRRIEDADHRALEEGGNDRRERQHERDQSAHQGEATSGRRPDSAQVEAGKRAHEGKSRRPGNLDRRWPLTTSPSWSRLPPVGRGQGPLLPGEPRRTLLEERRDPFSVVGRDTGDPLQLGLQLQLLLQARRP